MQLTNKQRAGLLIAVSAALCASIFLYFAAYNCLEIEDPIYSVAWAMLDSAKGEGGSANGVSGSAVEYSKVDTENLDFLYVNVLSKMRRHPSFNPYSIAYREFLRKNALPVSAEAQNLFERIDEKRVVQAIFYRDYLNYITK